MAVNVTSIVRPSMSGTSQHITPWYVLTDNGVPLDEG